jgi:hypothetical protein
LAALEKDYEEVGMDTVDPDEEEGQEEYWILAITDVYVGRFLQDSTLTVPSDCLRWHDNDKSFFLQRKLALPKTSFMLPGL